MDDKSKKWIKAVLANDEVSSDEELIEYFIKESGLTRVEAIKWVALRPSYIRDVVCDIEPGKEEPAVPYVLPTFNGYTVDRKLREYRKAEIGKAYLSFDYGCR